MPKRKANQRDIKQFRQHRVEQLLLRGYKAYEILEELSKTLINPTTNGPFSRETIEDDIRAIHADWLVRASPADVEAHRAANLAENREARRMGWQLKNLRAIYQGLKQEAELLGLDAPVKNEVSANLKQTITEHETDYTYTNDDSVTEQHNE